MDDTEILQRTYRNMKQIDRFFEGPEYQSLIDISIAAKTSDRKNAETILNQVDLTDDSIKFFTKKKEWKRCYEESVKLVTILRDCVDDRYDPI